MLRENECDNESVQGQGFTENEHNQHAHVEFIGTFGTDIAAIRTQTIVRRHVITIVLKPFATIVVFDPKALDADIAQNANRPTRRQATETAAQAGGKL